MASMTVEFLKAHDLPGRRDSVQHFEPGNRTGVDTSTGAALCAAGIARDVNGKLDAAAVAEAPPVPEAPKPYFGDQRADDAGVSEDEDETEGDDEL